MRDGAIVVMTGERNLEFQLFYHDTALLRLTNTSAAVHYFGNLHIFASFTMVSQRRRFSWGAERPYRRLFGC
jgi:hypothetical protein